MSRIRKRHVDRRIPGMLMLAFFVLFSCELLFAQKIPPSISINKLEKRFVYKSWTYRSNAVDDIEISQLAFPVSLSLFLGDRGSVSIRMCPALSSFGMKHFDDFSDVKIDGSCIIGDHIGLITFGISLPSGDERLSESELSVARAIAEDALDFPLSLYGTGYEGNIGLFWAGNVSNLTVGGGVSYFLRDKFKLFEEKDASVLDPGDEITVSLGLDKEIPYGDICADAYYTLRRRDTLGGMEVYDPGEKIVLHVSTNITYPPGLPVAFHFWIRNRWKFHSELLPLPEDFEFKANLREDLNTNPFQIEVGSIIKYKLGLRYSLLGLMELKDFTKNDAGSEDARIVGGGIGFRVNLSERITPEFNFKYYDGYLTDSSKRFEISGYQISGVLSVAF